jgi:hypothetical protein
VAVEIDGCKERRMNEWKDGYVEEQVGGWLRACVRGCRNRWMEREMEEEWMDGWEKR